MQSSTNPKTVLLALLISTFLSAIEGTIVSTAMPKIASDLGGVQLISWVVSVYLLTMVVTTPIYGKIADLFGRKIVFTIGTILFLLGSMLSGISHTMEQLIIFRAVQGLGAGALIPITFTIIGDIFSFEQRAKVQGWISGMWGIAGILGPLTGGLLVDYVSWRWIFYFNLPFGLISLFLIMISLHEQFEKKKPHIDYAGVITFTIGMCFFLYGLLNGGTKYAWGSGTMLGLFAAAAVFLLIFVWIEGKSPEPMLPLSLFRNRMISVSNMVGFLASSVLIAVNFYLPMWIQGVNGHGATSSGLTLLPMSITWPLSAMMFGKLVNRFGIRAITLFGSFLLVISGIGLTQVVISSPYWLLSIWMAAFGFGFGLAFTALTLAVTSAVDWKLRGAAVASNQFMRTLGQTIGIAVFGTLLNSAMLREMSKELRSKIDLNKALSPEYSSQLPHDVLLGYREALAGGLHHIFVVLAVIAAVSLVLAFGLPRPAAKEEGAKQSAAS